MKDKKLTVKINKPVPEVFDFTLNPKNTPKWVDSIVQEEVNEYPAKLGSRYRNQDKSGNWSEYVVSEYIHGKMFILIKNDNNYHVRYIFTPLEDNNTQLDYYEWVDHGDVDDSFTQEFLIISKVY